MWTPTKAAMDRALITRMLQRHDAWPASDPGAAPSEPAGASDFETPDLPMVYSMITDCHRQLVTISRGVWVAAAIGLFAAVRLLG